MYIYIENSVEWKQLLNVFLAKQNGEYTRISKNVVLSDSYMWARLYKHRMQGITNDYNT